METYIVKKCGNSIHVILDKKKYKIGDKVQIVSDDFISINLLLTEVKNIKEDIEKLKTIVGLTK